MSVISGHILFVSDFSVGAGYRIPGILDNTVVKDSNNMPYIPGTTIKGVIRRSCEEIAFMLDLTLPDPSRPGEHERSEIARIFGTEYMPAGFIFSSAYPVNAFGFESFHRHFTHRESKNMIDPRTGTAAEDHFFYPESATRELKFRFEITKNFIHETSIEEEDISFLLAGIRFTDRIGAKKTRGRGRCSFIIDNMNDVEVSIKGWLENKMRKNTE